MTAAGAGAITGIGLTSGTGFFVRETVGLTFGMPEEYARVASGNKARRYSGPILYRYIALVSFLARDLFGRSKIKWTRQRPW